MYSFARMLKHSSNSVCLKWTHVCLEFLNPQFSFTLMNGTTITIAVSYSSLKWSRYFKFLLSSLLHYSIHTFLVCPPSKYTSFNFIRVAASLKHFNGSLLYLELNSFSLRWPPRSLFLLLQCPTDSLAFFVFIKPVKSLLTSGPLTRCSLLLVQLPCLSHSWLCLIIQVIGQETHIQRGLLWSPHLKWSLRSDTYNQLRVFCAFMVKLHVSLSSLILKVRSVVVVILY